MVVDAGYLEGKHPKCGNFEYSQLHLNKSVPHLTLEFSKAKRHQLLFSPTISKEIQDAFSDLEVSAFAVDHRISNSRDIDRLLAE
ncbi:hypothetical protein TNCV_3751511 [Trichonephila clavipes]|nr:hypothetical protein TNCV_3751511 [Trichonephila clavipes]